MQTQAAVSVVCKGPIKCQIFDPRSLSFLTTKTLGEVGQLLACFRHRVTSDDVEGIIDQEPTILHPSS